MNIRIAGTVATSLAAFSALSGCIVVVGNRSDSYGAAYVAVDQPYRRIGVLLDSTTPALAAQTGAPTDRSCVIVGILPGTPAAAAGLQNYDVVTHVDGQEDASISAFRRTVMAHKVGDTVTLRIVRAGKAIDVTVQVEEVAATRVVLPPDSPAPDWRD